MRTMRRLYGATLLCGILCIGLVLGAGCDPEQARALREHPAICDLDYRRCMARVSRDCDFIDLDCLETEGLVCHTTWLICVRYHEGTQPQPSDAGRTDYDAANVPTE